MKSPRRAFYRTEAKTDPDIPALLDAIFLDAPDAVGVSSRNIIRVANPALARLFGYDAPSELVGRVFLELLAPESRREIEARIQQRARGEHVPGRYEAWALKRDGRCFQLEVRTTTFVHGGEAWALALLRDLGEEEGLYQAIFSRNTAVKLLIDPSDGRIVDANDAAVRFYGWPAERLRQMQIHEINTNPGVAVERDIGRATSGEQRMFRFRHRVASGEVRSVEVHTGPVEVRGRTLLLSIVQDTTERDAFEERLRQGQRLEAIGRLAGGIAHDFNNLLTIIEGCGTLIHDSAEPGSVVAQQASDLLQASRRAGELTSRLLAVGQRQELRPRPIDLSGVVREMDSLLRRAVGPDVELRLTLQEGLTVEVDPGQLEQVVMNLVLNARDATDGRGRVEVVVVRAGDGQVELCVVDEGRGMDEATRARVFEPFFTTRARGRGTGLGLASVYGIVTQSGGTITVDSEPGSGTTFRVRLPACRATHVLLLDDDDELRELIGECLVASGFEVTAFGSGAEALALSDDALAAIDVLVTDQFMPGQLGVDVARALRRRRDKLGIVLISGNLSRRDLAALPSWLTFVEKPFTRSTLTERIRSLVR